MIFTASLCKWQDLVLDSNHIEFVGETGSIIFEDYSVKYKDKMVERVLTSIESLFAMRLPGIIAMFYLDKEGLSESLVEIVNSSLLCRIPRASFEDRLEKIDDKIAKLEHDLLGYGISSSRLSYVESKLEQYTMLSDWIKSEPDDKVAEDMMDLFGELFSVWDVDVLRSFMELYCWLVRLRYGRIRMQRVLIEDYNVYRRTLGLPLISRKDKPGSLDEANCLLRFPNCLDVYLEEL